MSLNAAERRDTPVDTGGRLGMSKKAPRDRIQGITLPVHLLTLLKEIEGLESDAYLKMGGTTKSSMSDVIEQAVRRYAKWYFSPKGHGSRPVTEKDRHQFTDRLAKANLEELESELTTGEDADDVDD
jgi:hypothetical protein